MKKLYITFGGVAYDGTVAHAVEDGPRFGADEVKVYDDLWLTGTAFYRINHWLWNVPPNRGFGWYAFKPFIILDALEKINAGDAVLYVDGDTYPTGDFSTLYQICAQIGGIMLFKECGINNRQYCKRDCFVVMGQDEPRYHDCQHFTGRFALFQKGSWRAQQFLMEWLTYCVNPLANTIRPSVLAPELDGFTEHRSDQSILTLLGHKYGCRPYRAACEWGDNSSEDKELYGTIFKQVHASGSQIVTGSHFRNVPDRTE